MSNTMMFRCKRSILVSVIAAVVSPSLAMAQAKGGDGAVTPAIQQLIAEVQAQGLPTAGILERVKFGYLVRASATQVEDVAREHARRLAAARTALQPSPTSVDVEAGATALANRIPADAVRDIRRLRTDRSVAVPLGVFTQLVVSGMAVGDAKRGVLDALRVGAQDAQFLAFQDDIMRDVERGIRIDASFNVRYKRLVATLPAGSGNALAADAAATTPSFGTATERAKGATKPGSRPPR